MQTMPKRDKSNPIPQKKSFRIERQRIDFSFEGEIDKEQGVIRNVAVLGAKSANGYEYKNSALQSAVKVFEGSKVFIDHSEERSGHSLKDYAGRLEGLYFDSRNRKVKAKLLRLVNPLHEDWILTLAERDPSGFGLSIDAEVKVDQDDNPVEIIRGFSVDFVTEPATNVGLFERRRRMATQPKGKKKEEITINWDGLTYEDIKNNRPDILEQMDPDLQKALEDLKMSLETSLETLNTLIGGNDEPVPDENTPPEGAGDTPTEANPNPTSNPTPKPESKKIKRPKVVSHHDEDRKSVV